jgi:integrase
MSLTIFKRGKIYHYRGTVNGRLLRGTTGTSQKGIAERFIAELEAKHWKGHFDGPGAVLTFAQAAILYRDAGKPTRFLDRVEDYWKDTLVKDINSGMVQKAAITLCPKSKGSTRNRNVIVPTQAVINHAAEMELCNHLKVKRFVVTTKTKTPATWEWVSAFMAAGNPHIAALCGFMFLTGARVSEAIDVRWGDLNLAAAKARIRQTKVGKEREAHLPPALIVAIANIEGNRGSEEKVFKYSSRHTLRPQWEMVIKRAKLPSLTFHACRHGFATSLLHKGIDPVTVAKLGGWSTPELVFKTYGHAREDATLANLLVDTRSAQLTNTEDKTRIKSVS